MESLHLGWVEQCPEAGPGHWFHPQCPWVPAWVVPEGVVGMEGQLVLLVLLALVAVMVCVRWPAAAAAAGLVFALLVVHGCDGPSEAFV